MLCWSVSFVVMPVSLWEDVFTHFTAPGCESFNHLPGSSVIWLKHTNCRIKRWTNRETQRHAHLHTQKYPKPNPPALERCFSASRRGQCMSSSDIMLLPIFITTAIDDRGSLREGHPFRVSSVQPAHLYAVALRKRNQSTCG